MPLLKTPKNFHSEERILLLWHATETLQELMEQYPAEADEAKEKLASSASASRRLEILATHILFHKAFGTEASLEHLPSGRPIAKGSKRHMSISHSHGIVALAASQHPIGIDIEKWGPRALRIADKYLSPEEKHLLGDEPERAAVSLWCAKEAAFKLWDEPKTTVFEDIRLNEEEEGRIVATHLEAPHLRANIRLLELEEAAFAVATDY